MQDVPPAGSTDNTREQDSQSLSPCSVGHTLDCDYLLAWYTSNFSVSQLWPSCSCKGESQTPSGSFTSSQKEGPLFYPLQTSILNLQEGYNVGRTVNEAITLPCSTADAIKLVTCVSFALLVILFGKLLVAQIPEMGLLNSGRWK